MPATKVYIKNMVCPRCIQSVESILTSMNIEAINIELGMVILPEELPANDLQQFGRELDTAGFSLLDNRTSQLINQIKSIIIEQIHYTKEPSPQNLSTILSDKLLYDYSYLSRLFSSVEGRTIEKFVIAQKIEKVKELLSYDQLTLEEIAFQLHYSSAAHLSSQFKKVTGMSPTRFRKERLENRKPLDAL